MGTALERYVEIALKAQLCQVPEITLRANTWTNFQCKYCPCFDFIIDENAIYKLKTSSGNTE